MTTPLMIRRAVSSESFVKKSRLPSTSIMRLGLALLMMLPEILRFIFVEADPMHGLEPLYEA